MNRIVGSFGSLTRTVTPATYTVSGTVTVSGVALSGVTITSVALGNTTTDGSGNYSYTLVPIGTAYTITPTKTGYTFSAAATGTVTGTTTANFTATLNTYTISGTILVSAVALSGVTITSVALGNTATDGSGNYSYANVPHGTAYTITPSKTGYTFSPTSTSGTATAAATVSFAGTASTFSPGTYGTAVAFWDFTTAANALKSGGTSAANNEKIDQISDTIGTFHFKQTTDANRPTLKTAILNGFQVADFASASSNFMAMQNQTTFRKNYAALSMLFIVKPGTGAFTSQNCLFTSWNNAFNEGTRIYFNATTLLSSSGKRVDTDTSTLKSTPTSTFAVGTWYINSCGARSGRSDSECLCEWDSEDV
jgi:hypothetical protein